MYLYLERDWAPSLAPPVPGPRPSQRERPAPSPPQPLLGRKGWLQRQTWVKVWEGGKKEIFIFELLCLFCLRLKDGKTKHVCLLLVFLCPLPLLGKRSQGLLASFHLALPHSWGSGKGKPRFPIHKRRMGQEEGRSLPSSGLGLRKLGSSEPRWEPPVQPQDLVSPAWTPS